jgi:gamma-glutamyl-gamma-aminobutyrate hydrolase PuuD|tara:strand:+ start:2019 stop:2588 length:570 start_codon:yes stop_codon:yes gene_type:complete
MIYIVPAIKSQYKKQYEISLDIKLIEFLKKFYNKDVRVLTEISNLNKNCKLLVISGGNTIPKISKKEKDQIRSKFDCHYFKQAINNKIPILGICHGAQFIASFFSSKLNPIINHVGNHFITHKGKKFKVNSFHNYGIIRLGKKLLETSRATDESIESFTHKNHKIKGIMWHPERNDKIKKIDKLILLNT